MVFPVQPGTTPPIQSTSGANTNRLLTLWGRNGFLTILLSCCRGFVMRNSYLAFRIELRRRVGHQGPGGPRDPIWFSVELRGCPTATCLCKSFQIHWDSSYPRVGGRRTRYSVLLPWYFVTSAQSQKDKFETLCYVQADLSTAPYKSKLTETGKTSYQRDANVILLVGLTELKAQVSWIDSQTVRPMSFYTPHAFPSPDPHVREYRKQREGS